MVEEMPPQVQAACRRLKDNGDFATLVQWAATIHGVGGYDYEPDTEVTRFKDGQCRAVMFFAEAGDVTVDVTRPKVYETDTSVEE